MKSEERTMKPMGRRRKCDALKKWSLGLQVRMTISYVGVTLVIVLLLELVVVLGVIAALTRSLLVGALLSNTAQHTAQTYALEAALQAGGTALDPNTTFQPGYPSSLDVLTETLSRSGRPPSTLLPGEIIYEKVPYIGTPSLSYPASAVALLIAPNSQVLASSYPARYPLSTPVAQLLPHQAQLIFNALAGKSASTVEDTAQDRVAFAVETVWSREKKPIGAIYVQVPLGLSNGQIFYALAGIWLDSGLPWLFLMLPIGTVFGLVTTRGLVRRIHRLAKTTTQFAAGQFELRLPASKKDEIGQLEQAFNQMAEQLVESMEQRQVLIEQSVRREERARNEQEMRTARNIQQALLPKDVPELAGWQLAPYYQPARQVGGDFYDFLSFEDGRLGIIIGDATDKGMPAALMMATTCTMLRTAAQATASPGEVLARVNELLATDIPPGMFVTCFYALLDPENGHLHYANAGHDLPYQRHSTGVTELRATGMPLGMMPGSSYEEQKAVLAPGESILFYSDGLVEAHDSKRDMFGFPRLMGLIGAHPGGIALIDFLLGELATFTGADWEQEDDVTMVALHRASLPSTEDAKQGEKDEWSLLAEWTVPSVPGNERQAMERAAEVVRPFNLSPGRLDDLKTAVAEAVMNAMEHGNSYQPDKEVTLQVLASEQAIAVRIGDQGELPLHLPISAAPDLEAKLAELQSPRGWGLFLIKNLVDELHVTNDAHSHVIELIMRQEEVSNGNQKL